MDNLSDRDRLEIERKYVKTTYDEIANDFSKTRYKKWPRVESFLENLNDHSLLLDVGCGNGKYMDNLKSFNIGCDISSGLLSICRRRKFEVVNCDMSQLPFRKRSFDALICIAALHHIVSAERRRKSLESMIDLLIGGGRMFLQVWAFEQVVDNSKYLSPRKMLQRKHMSSITIETKSDKSIKIPIHDNKTPFTSQEMLVPFRYRPNAESEFNESLRYYHLFAENELNDIVESIEGADIVDSFYDQGNWCAVIKRC